MTTSSALLTAITQYSKMQTPHTSSFTSSGIENLREHPTVATVGGREYPWAPRRGYSEILPCAPLAQRLRSLARLTKQPWGQDPFVKKSI
jgi:hypothetical protein